VESVRDIALKIATGQAFVDEDAVRLAEAWLSEQADGEKKGRPEPGSGFGDDRALASRGLDTACSESDEEAA
jgi:hypothetical protein